MRDLSPIPSLADHDGHRPFTDMSTPEDRKSTRLNSSHTVIYTLSLHDALPIYFHQTRESLALFGGDVGAWEPPVGGVLSAIAFYPPVSAAELVIRCAIYPRSQALQTMTATGRSPTCRRPKIGRAHV